MKVNPKDLEQLLGFKVYLVGGAVRDLVLGLEPNDYDFSTPANPDEIEDAITRAGRRAYTVGKRFGTIGFKYEYAPKEFKYVEITTFRTEAYSDTRKPIVSYTDNLQDDMSRRDFTINAMAIKSDGKYWDEYGGKTDIDNKIIKAVGSPKARFKEDPLRILRAVRFAARYNFQIEEKTKEYCSKMKYELLRVSKERWISELDKILSGDNIEYALTLLMELGLFKVIIPILDIQYKYDQNNPHHDFDLWTHTLKVTSSVPKENLDLRWAALLHDIAKPITRTENPKGYSNYINHDILGAEMALSICKHLKFSNERTDYIVEVIKTHLKPESDLKKYDDGGKKYVKINQEDAYIFSQSSADEAVEETRK